MVPNAKSPPAETASAAEPLPIAEPLHNGPAPPSSPEPGSADSSDRTEGGPDAHSRVQLVLTPPMPHSAILRVMTLGFVLAVLLVLTAAYFGYRGSRAIQS